MRACNVRSVSPRGCLAASQRGVSAACSSSTARCCWSVCQSSFACSSTAPGTSRASACSAAVEAASGCPVARHSFECCSHSRPASPGSPSRSASWRRKDSSGSWMARLACVAASRSRHRKRWFSCWVPLAPADVPDPCRSCISVSASCTSCSMCSRATLGYARTYDSWLMAGKMAMMSARAATSPALTSSNLPACSPNSSRPTHTSRWSCGPRALPPADGTSATPRYSSSTLQLPSLHEAATPSAAACVRASGAARRAKRPSTCCSSACRCPTCSRQRRWPCSSTLSPPPPAPPPPPMPATTARGPLPPSLPLPLAEPAPANVLTEIEVAAAAAAAGSPAACAVHSWCS
mmetsp:Transcript_43936/g.131714  ORF Transcript_43936/g.131714 Transcript_43936/m.131714 type:complete len:349 (-) Transcript_43936:1379-2425(-)